MWRWCHLFVDNMRGESWLGLKYNGGTWHWEDGTNEEVSSRSKCAPLKYMYYVFTMKYYVADLHNVLLVDTCRTKLFCVVVEMCIRVLTA